MMPELEEERIQKGNGLEVLFSALGGGALEGLWKHKVQLIWRIIVVNHTACTCRDLGSNWSNIHSRGLEK